MNEVGELQKVNDLMNRGRYMNKDYEVEDFNRIKFKDEEVYNPKNSLYNFFERMAQEKRKKTAIIYEDKNQQTIELTYEQLDYSIDCLAKKIQELQFKESINIGVYFERSPYTLIAILAILKTGNTYVPIDNSYPHAYLEYILNDAKISLLLTRQENLNDIENKEVLTMTLDFISLAHIIPKKERVALNKSHPKNNSFILYTSGTTGHPKGVRHQEAAVLYRFRWETQTYPFVGSDRICQKTNINFTPAMWEFFTGLLNGIVTVFLTDRIAKDPYALVEALEKYEVTRFVAVPSLLKRILEIPNSAQKLSHIRLWTTCGEPVYLSLVKQFCLTYPHSVLLADYGATEVASALYFDTSEIKGVPVELLGYKTTQHLKTFILDEFLNPVPAGVVGELYVAGPSVSKGYINLPEEDKKKFINNPFTSDSCLCDMGDLAKYLSDGRIQILGRKDQQVKINGIRIELSSIEEVISQYNMVKEVCVVAKKIREGVNTLIAYVVSKELGESFDNDLKNFLMSKLPVYMVPSQFIYLEKLPHTPNGKINRKEIVNLKHNEPRSNISNTKLNAIQQELLNIISKLVGIKKETISLNKPFTELGLNSLIIIDFLNKLNRQYHLTITLAMLFDYPTIEQLSNYLMLHTEVIKEQSTCIQSKLNQEHKIAIIGMSGRFPEADNVDEFWDNLIQKKDCVIEVPKTRWDYSQYYDLDVKVPFKANSKWGGFLKEIDQFDAEFFNISPREAIMMDPQQRLTLEESWKALEDAGYVEDNLNDKSIGVFIGARTGDYKELLNQNNEDLHLYRTLGCDPAVLSARISYYLNLKGPCLTLDTACSSSLTAIHLASESLKNGQCELALAGGVNIMCSSRLFIESSKMGILSKDGKCKAFDNEANGVAISEGVGIVILKRLEDALRDNDRIYGVIIGSGINQDGKTNGIVAPSVDAQERLISSIYQQNNINPKDINYIECHGTGTKLGDPLEVEALSRVFSKIERDSSQCILGSVKTNIGHTVASSGVIGLIKVLLAMQHGQIPAILHFKHLNKLIALEKTPFSINTDTLKWCKPQMAAISSFGFSGTNAHIVVEEPPLKKPHAKVICNYYIIPLSAKTENSLINRKDELKKWLENEGMQYGLDEIAYTLQQGRVHFPIRFILVVDTLAELEEKLALPLEVLKKQDEVPDKRVKEKEIQQLIKDYQMGNQVDWTVINKSHEYSVIHMCSYPFQGEHYWFKPIVNQRVNYLSPLDSSIQDHIIEDKKILAAAVQLHLVLKNLKSLKPDNKYELQNISWQRTVELNEASLVGIEVKISTLAQGLKYTLSTKDNQIISTGNIVSQEKTYERQNLNMAELREHCHLIIDHQEFYNQCIEKGLHYKSSYQVIDKIYISDNELLTSIVAKKDREEEFFKPQVLDGILHSLLALPAMANEVDLLPFSMEQFIIYHPIPYKCYAYTQVTTYSKDNHLLKVNIHILSESGEVIGKIIGFTVLGRKNEVLLVTNKWIQEDAKNTIKSLEGPTIIFAPQNSQFHITEPSIEVKKGSTYKVISSNQYEVNNIKEDYDRLFSRIQIGRGNSLNILYLWPLEISNNSQMYLENGIKGLFNIVKSLMDVFSHKQRITLIYSYNGKLTEAYPYYAALKGFTRTLGLEMTHFNFKAVELLNVPETQYIDILMKEFLCEATDIRYEGKIRYIQQFEFIKSNMMRKYPVGEYNGIYIITGGLGAIGRIFVKHILKDNAASVILLGRSKLSISKKALLDELKEVNPRVTYITCDISKEEQVKTTFNMIRSKYGEISGVLHCAGIIKDRLFFNKTKEEFDEVLKSKIDGTLNLDQVTAKDRLGFFCVFSSIASMFGSVGQSDYSYANSFLDHFVYLREKRRELGKRYGQTMAINWPLWESGGMQIPLLNRQQMELEKGMYALSNQEGIDAFERVKDLALPSIGILVGKKTLLQRFILSINRQKVRGENKIDTMENNNQTLLVLKITNYLKELLAEETQLPMDKVYEHKAFDEYGINSLMVMNLNNKLEEKLGNISQTIFYEYQDIASMAQGLSKQYLEKWIKIFHITEGPTQSETIQEEKTLSVVSHIENEITEHKIAIIGISGRYPMAETLEELWDNLKIGKDCITEIPIERWDYHKYYDSNRYAIGKSYSKWGGFLKDIECFDPLFFNISPKEAETMDPQERLFLETAWQTLEDAGYTKKRLEKANVGVFVGVMWNQYQLYGDLLESADLPASHNAAIANRVSYTFNFHGPSMAIETYCSSSMYAIKLACDSIIQRESDYALAGGVNLMVHPNKYVQLSNGQFVSTDGRCRSFGEGGSGYVPGEGVGAVLLKPLQSAIADGDHIYGVIIAAVTNHGGKVNGYTVPSPVAQGKLIKMGLQQAQISPLSISYIEAHGTGTVLGDPIEVEGIRQAFETYTDKKEFCPMGSVKSNIGHLESAGGIAGLTKVLLQMKYKMLVPSIHAETLNEKIDFKNAPVYVQKRLEKWQQPQVEINGELESYPRRAGISCFGAGGANAFLLVEEYAPDQFENKLRYIKQEQLIVLSAYNEESLTENVKNLRRYIKTACYYQQGYSLKELIADEINIPVEQLVSDESLGRYLTETTELVDLITAINKNYHIHIDLYEISLENTLKDLELLIQAKQPIQELQHNEVEISLENIAYTLQVGRESLGKRVAIIAKDLFDLYDKLGCFLEHKKVEGLFIQKEKVQEELFQDLSRDEDYIQLIKTWFKKRNYIPIAKLWVEGLLIDWVAIGGLNWAKIISLPTYSFSRKRKYWVTTKEIACCTDKLNYLIDKNISTIGDQKYSKLFTKDDSMIIGHKVNGKSVIPGATLIEMARAAGEYAQEVKDIYIIKSVYWLKTIGLDSKEEVIVHIQPLNSEFSFTLTDVTNKIVYAKGILSLDKAELTQNKMDVQAIKSRCQNEIPKTTYYELFKKRGLEYDGAYQAVKEIQYNKNGKEALICVELSENITLEDHIKVHPILLDGIFQATFALGTNKVVEVPFSVDEIVLYKEKLPKNCMIYVQKHDNSYDMVVMDMNAQILMTVKDFLVKPINTLISKVDISNQLIYLDEVWKEESLVSSFNAEEKKEILVFNQKDVSRLKAISGVSHVISVNSGSGFEYQNLDCQIDYKEESNYVQLLDLLNQKSIKLTHILYYWETDINKSLIEQVDEGATKIYNLIHALAEESYIHSISMVIVFKDSSMELINSQIQAFLKCIVLEQTHNTFKTIWLEDGGENPNLLINELMNASKSIEEVKYTCGKRFIKKLQELDVKVTTKNQVIPVRDQGVYLITGGAGGLGISLSKYLAHTKACHIILVGRSALTKQKSMLLKSIEGSHVQYVQVDLSQFNEVQALYSKIIKEYGKINGIIHSAGVTKDCLIKNKSFKDFEQVLAPKVRGLIYLNEVTKNEHLDYFVTFSSIAAVIGNIGQADYAFANCFMDYFMEKRNQEVNHGHCFGKSYSINWPIWEEGGMNISQDKLTRMTVEMGIEALPTAIGIKVFEEVILRGQTKNIPLFGNEKQIKKYFLQNSDSLVWDEVKEKQPSYELTYSFKELLNIVKQIVADTTKASLSEINENDSFEKFGVDSVMLTQMGRQLEKQIDIQDNTAFIQGNTPKEVAVYLASHHTTTMNSNRQNMSVRKEIVSSSTSLKPIKDFIKQLIADITKLDIQDIHDEEPFEKLGIDSVMLTKLGFKLEKEKGIKDSAAFIQFNTVEKVSTYLMQHYAKEWEHVATGPVETDHVTQNPVISQTRFVEEDKIVVVGMSGKFPMANTIDSFWKNLKAGKNCITEVPIERWNANDFYRLDPQDEYYTKSKWGGFIEGVKAFDPLFFNISPIEAAWIDPQERLMLEAVWHALEDGGYSKAQLKEYKKQGHEVGVFIGCMAEQYPWVASDLAKGAQLTVASYWSIANRISYFLDANGPSMAINTACSSAITALHLAIESLKNGECSLAIVGGINLSLHPYKYMILSQRQLISGMSKSCGLGATDGYVPGEGVAAVILTTEKLAKMHHDFIRCAIKASVINHNGGSSNTYRVPSVETEKQLIIKAFKEAGIQSDEISYYETAANGSELGDAVEIQALNEAYAELGIKGKCAIGAVKSNIGHLEAASGLSQLIKVILQLQHKQLVPSINTEILNPRINLTHSPFYIQDKLETWDASKPLMAAINCFGAGGSNAVLIVEEYEEQLNLASALNISRECVYPFSAANLESLKRMILAYKEYLEKHSLINLNSLSYTLGRREKMNIRLACIATSREELLEELMQYLEGNITNKKIVINNPVKQNAVLHNESEAYAIAQGWVYDDIQLPTGNVQEKQILLQLPLYPFDNSDYWINDLKNNFKIESSVKENTRVEESNIMHLKEILSKLLQIPMDKIDSEASFNEYGMDSLMTFKMINILETEYEPKLDIKTFLQHYSINQLDQILQLKESKQQVQLIQSEVLKDANYYLKQFIVACLAEGNLTPSQAITLKNEIINTLNQ